MLVANVPSFTIFKAAQYSLGETYIKVPHNCIEGVTNYPFDEYLLFGLVSQRFFTCNFSWKVLVLENQTWEVPITLQSRVFKEKIEFLNIPFFGETCSFSIPVKRITTKDNEIIKN